MVSYENLLSSGVGEFIGKVTYNRKQLQMGSNIYSSKGFEHN